MDLILTSAPSASFLAFLFSDSLQLSSCYMLPPGVISYLAFCIVSLVPFLVLRCPSVMNSLTHVPILCSCDLKLRQFRSISSMQINITHLEDRHGCQHHPGENVFKCLKNRNVSMLFVKKNQDLSSICIRIAIIIIIFDRKNV